MFSVKCVYFFMRCKSIRSVIFLFYLPMMSLFSICRFSFCEYFLLRIIIDLFYNHWSYQFTLIQKISFYIGTNHEITIMVERDKSDHLPTKTICYHFDLIQKESAVMYLCDCVKPCIIF